MATFSDDFNRADGALGSNWTFTGAAGSQVEIISQEVAINTSNNQARAFWTTACDTDNNRSQITYSVVGTGFLWAVCRVASTSVLTYYGTQARVADGQVRLYKVVTGSATQLSSSYSTTISSGDVIAVTADGSTIEALYNGATTAVSVTDTSITAGTYVGFHLAGSDTGQRADDWSGGDLPTGALWRNSGNWRQSITWRGATSGGTNATVTPTAVAAVASVGTATPAAGSTVTPTTVAAVAASPAPTVDTPLVVGAVAAEASAWLADYTRRNATVVVGGAAQQGYW